MNGRLAASWDDASFAVIAALACLSASLANCPRVSVKSVSKAGVEIATAIPSPEPTTVLMDDDEREFQDDRLEPCGPPDIRLLAPSSLTLAQIKPAQSVFLSLLTPAQRPLRC
jgi:hypothetical protein